MHPALSIIAFTTLSGLGYGLAVMLGLGLLDPAATATKFAHFTALALMSAGLMSSTLHLGNPQRAWRALSQWRSSWLSREGVMAIITFIPLCAAAYLSIFEGRAIVWIGLIGAALSLVTVYCTAMIYASLKSVPRWHTGWTPASYLSFSLASGGVLATLFSAFNGDAGLWLPLLAALLVAAAWAIKFRWRERARNLRQESTPETATGLGNIGKVRLFEPPHMTENYLTREMGFVVARKHAVKLFRIAFALGAAIPFILMILTAMADRGTGGILLSLTAALCLAVGLLVERWLFFAEARHVVMNYYGK
jgi:DMSO reductase anchor subunit